MSEKNAHIDYLIARCIAGEATNTERLELDGWMEQSEANRKYFEGISFADQKAVASQPFIKVDVDKAWEKLNSRMKQGRELKAEPGRARVIALPLWLRVAAMVALVSGLALLLYQQWGKTSPDNWEMVASIPSDSITQYTLADQSTIILNRNSKLAYASDFGKADRRVKLSGEAFFKVQPDTAKPFIVETGETYIRVTGTSFNIKGQEADSIVEVYVKTGSVLFFTANNEGVSLVAGEVGVYNKIRNTFTKTVAVDPNATAYASRVFVFYNTTLNEVFRQLGKVYNVSIILEKPQIGLCTITVSFDDDEIGTILSVIAETLDLKLTVDQQTFRFDGEGCANGANTP